MNQEIENKHLEVLDLLLRRIFGSKRHEVMGDLRKLRHKELHSLYFSSIIIRMIILRRKRWAGHGARM
jgi:hypothetical protein